MNIFSKIFETLPRSSTPRRLPRQKRPAVIGRALDKVSEPLFQGLTQVLHCADVGDRSGVSLAVKRDYGSASDKEHSRPAGPPPSHPAESRKGTLGPGASLVGRNAHFGSAYIQAQSLRGIAKVRECVKEGPRNNRSVGKQNLPFAVRPVRLGYQAYVKGARTVGGSARNGEGS